MKVVFIGAVELSHRALTRVLTSDAQVVGVCTLESSSINADHRDLRPLCAAHDVDCIYVDDINSHAILDWIAARRPEVIFCFGWSRLLRRPLLELAPLGVVGFHPAALPANRGRHPITWALALGLERTASTFFFMDESADGGDILSQRSIDICSGDDAGSLYDKIAQCALEQISEFVPQLISGNYPRVPQDSNLANSWRKRGRADGQIDWRMSAQSIHNLVRALTTPYVGAHFRYRDMDVKVWKTRVVPDVAPNLEPGKVLQALAEGSVIVCGQQAIQLLRTQPEIQLLPGEYL